MKRTKKQFTVDRIVPDSEGKLHIKVGIHLLLSLCLVPWQSECTACRGE